MVETRSSKKQVRVHMPTPSASVRKRRGVPKAPIFTEDDEDDKEEDDEDESVLAPASPTDEAEFGGALGACFMIPLLVLTIYFLYFGASAGYKFNVWNYQGFSQQLPSSVASLCSYEACYVYFTWFCFNVLLERTLFHEKVQGVVLRTSKRLPYRISGHLHFWAALLVLLHCFPVFDKDTGAFMYLTRFPLSWAYDHYLEFATASMIFSFILSVYLYAKSFNKGALLALGGNTGNVVFDFFIGRELNPRIGSFDWKVFCELRPGLILWQVLNIACAVKQYETLGRVTAPMVLINAFQGLYVFDALYHERAILTTMDITCDGFGFMLAFGDLAWVPFTYSLQSRYLVENSPELSTSMLVLLCALNFAGYMVFRGSNSEKDAFRTNPDSEQVAHLEYLTTKTGRKLLVSGWWGCARKINYTGDWMMGLAWCACTGTGCVVTYFYAIYFFILLVHRAMRDDHSCGAKYGNDWAKYKARVPYVFIPKVI